MPILQTFSKKVQKMCAALALGALPLKEGGGAKHSPPGKQIFSSKLINFINIENVIHEHYIQVATGKNHENHHFSKIIKTHPNVS